MIEGYTSTPTGFHLKSLVLVYTPQIRMKSVEIRKTENPHQGGLSRFSPDSREFCYTNITFNTLYSPESVGSMSQYAHW